MMDFENRLTIDRRRARATVVTHYVLNAIAPVLERLENLEQMHAAEVGLERPRRPYKEVHRLIYDVLSAVGVEIITDADRAMAGLEPRDHNGLTETELSLIEDRVPTA